MEGDDMHMRVALTVWERRVSPVFDCARLLLVADIENQTVIGRCYIPFLSTFPALRAAKLFDLGIDVLICGAISHVFASTIESYGIRIFPFVTGDPNRVLDAYLSDTLHRAEFQMPGFGTNNNSYFRKKL
jgi:predicted Fe-Mo cluster-binding NifX family protein